MAALTPLANVTPEEVLHVLHRLRPRDHSEIFALRFDSPGAPDLDQYAAELLAVPGFSWMAHASDGEPVAIIGARPVWPGVWAVFAFGTDRWSEVMRLLTRHVLRFMQGALVRSGAHLAFCFAAAEHTDAREWLTRMGARAENTMTEWGRGREDYVMYAWRA